jgi:hypothetical protein
VTAPRRVSARDLNRATLARQWLLERHRAEPAEAVGAIAGLQAQHANSPYIALWSRVRDLAIADLEAALEDRSVVKATVMRSTLHLAAAKDFFTFDAATADSRVVDVQAGPGWPWASRSRVSSHIQVKNAGFGPPSSAPDTHASARLAPVVSGGRPCLCPFHRTGDLTLMRPSGRLREVPRLGGPGSRPSSPVPHLQ